MRLILAAAVCAAMLAACGGEERAPAAGSGVEIEHQLGTTTIEGPPQRVVTVGLRDQDFALALGVKPLGVASWFGDTLKDETGPWAHDLYGEDIPEIIANTDGPSYEKIAALRPDLILGVYSGMTETQYKKLSQIAPTIADPKGFADYTVPWQDQLAITGKALGKAQEAEDLTADIDAQFAAARKAHPDFEGKSVIYGGLAGQFPGAYTSGDQRASFLEDLGFEVPKEINALSSEGNFFVELSPEKYKLFERDVVVALGENPLLDKLDAAKEGRVITVDELKGSLSGALSFSSPLSLPYALEEMVPRLEAAVDGDPATKVEPEPPIAY